MFAAAHRLLRGAAVSLVTCTQRDTRETVETLVHVIEGCLGLHNLLTAHDVQCNTDKPHTMFWLGSQHVGVLVEPHWLTVRLQGNIGAVSIAAADFFPLLSWRTWLMRRVALQQKSVQLADGRERPSEK